MERKPCYEIGIIERENQILARDLMIERDGKKYTVSVGTAQYKTELEAHRVREGLTPPTEHEVLVMDNISSVEDICQSLLSMSFETLKPYLTEQVLQENLK